MDDEQLLSIQHWLLNSNIQIPTGSEKGAIAGWLNDTGTPEFAYLEATGYFLTCMAFMLLAAPSRREEILKRTDRAFEWLYRNSKIGEMPPTRRYLCGRGNDWRNRVVFSFDLAMVIRGLDAVRRLVNARRRRVVEKVIDQALIPCCRGSFLQPCYCQNHGNRIPPPQRWSTTAGPYQVKCAAALLFSAGSALPQAIRSASENVYATWRHLSTLPTSVENLHAHFYFLEGLVLFGLHRRDLGAWRLSGATCKSLFGESNLRDYLSSNFLNDKTPLRSDVLAQALRFGCILRSCGYLKGETWWRQLEDQAANLRTFVRPDGAVSFYKPSGDDSDHWNSWSTMFAYQALSFYAVLSMDRRLDENWIKLLI